jgi:hypothetical protein
MQSEAILLIIIAAIFLITGIFGKQSPRAPGDRDRPRFPFNPATRVALFVLAAVFLLLGISRLMT